MVVQDSNQAQEPLKTIGMVNVGAIFYCIAFLSVIVRKLANANYQVRTSISPINEPSLRRLAGELFVTTRP
jgi:hypothetical protein